MKKTELKQYKEEILKEYSFKVTQNNGNTVYIS